ncbi:MAG: lysylphosphatidylglycerol synthase transmembrane domain-containing protein [Flavobacteriales bacterium]
MKKPLIAILKVIVPLALGVWLVIYFYRQLDEQQRTELFAAFGQANWWWVLFSMVLGWFSHLSRAWRWRYLLKHMGYNVGIWNAYNATMTGYFMNMLLPRAGEASRAVMLYRAEGVPFERGFGTILAERTVDLVLLIGLTAVTAAMQWDRLGEFRQRIADFRSQQATSGEEASSGGWGWWVLVVALVIGVAAAYMVLSRPERRARFKDGVRGFVAGLKSVFQTKDKAGFFLFSFIIWTLYVTMFWVGFFALPTTADVPFPGVLAGFIAGSIGIILVQGGIGAYPAFVALIVSMYMTAPENGGLIRPDALAMGWLLWVAQTALVIVLGGLSLLLISRKRNPLPA